MQISKGNTVVVAQSQAPSGGVSTSLMSPASGIRSPFDPASASCGNAPGTSEHALASARLPPPYCSFSAAQMQDPFLSYQPMTPRTATNHLSKVLGLDTMPSSFADRSPELGSPDDSSRVMPPPVALPDNSPLTQHAIDGKARFNNGEFGRIPSLASSPMTVNGQLKCEGVADPRNAFSVAAEEEQVGPTIRSTSRWSEVEQTRDALYDTDSLGIRSSSQAQPDREAKISGHATSTDRPDDPFENFTTASTVDVGQNGRDNEQSRMVSPAGITGMSASPRSSARPAMVAERPSLTVHIPPPNLQAPQVLASPSSGYYSLPSPVSNMQGVSSSRAGTPVGASPHATSWNSWMPLGSAGIGDCPDDGNENISNLFSIGADGCANTDGMISPQAFLSGSNFALPSPSNAGLPPFSARGSNPSPQLPRVDSKPHLSQPPQPQEPPPDLRR